MSSGILLLNKPEGVTSFDCIRDLKRKLNRTDLGHAGTLDKFATGLLPILMGEGLKLARFFMESHPALPVYWKSYRGTFTLGTATETGDPEGAVLRSSVVPPLTIARIVAAMQSFLEGAYEQTPPSYSAKKVGGERSSDLAREGRAPELKPVMVQISRFECLSFTTNTIEFEVTCSKGTYVRRLAEDFARRLETDAYVSSLVRTSIGPFHLADATPLAEVSADGSQVRGMSEATCFLPSFRLLPGEEVQLKNGKWNLVATRLANSGLPPSVYCAKELDPSGAEFAVALFDLSSDGRAKLLRGLSRE